MIKIKNKNKKNNKKKNFIKKKIFILKQNRIKINKILLYKGELV